MRRCSPRNDLTSLVSALGVIGLSSLLVAACGGAGGDCTGGAEGCACVERECLGDLVCSTQDVCEDPNGGSTGVMMDGPSTDAGASGGWETDGGSAGGKGDGSTGGGGERCAENSPPEIVEVNVQGSAIAAREDLRITITVADADGLDDVAGARLELPDGSSFKSMGKVSQDGFAAEPDWFYDVYYDVYYDGIGDEIPLDTLIEFQIAVDDSCATTRTPLPLTVCGGGGDSLCDGECRDTDFNEQSCGSCDNACDEGDYCDYGSCDMDYAAVPEDAEASGASQPISLPRDRVSLSFGAATPARERVDVTGFAL